MFFKNNIYSSKQLYIITKHYSLNIYQGNIGEGSDRPKTVNTIETQPCCLSCLKILLFIIKFIYFY